MIYFLNLVVSYFFPGLVEWWTRWNAAAVVEPPVDENDFARALAALAGILILGLGGVLIIGFTGRWYRRWAFADKKQNTAAPKMSSLEKVDWSKSKHASESPSSAEGNQGDT